MKLKLGNPKEDLLSLISAKEDFSNSPIDTKIDFIEEDIDFHRKQIKQIRTLHYTLYPEPQTGSEYLKHLAEMEDQIQYARDRVTAAEEEKLKLTNAIKSTPFLLNSFEDFLVNPRPELMKLIVKLYSNPVEKKDIAFLMFALASLEELKFDPLYEITQLHRALEKLLGNIGSRQYLNQCLNNIRRLSRNDSNDLQFHYNQLKIALKG